MIDGLLSRPQFGVPPNEKAELLLAGLNALTEQHARACPEYGRILRALGYAGAAATLTGLPFIPVSLFKTHVLRSVPAESVTTVMTSSGTSGQAVSRISLDAETAALQARALAAVIGDAVGRQRLPMLVVDAQATIRDPRLLSARGAGIVGMMRFGRHHRFLLDEDMVPSRSTLEQFLALHGSSPFLIFGFTFMVWQYLYDVVGVDTLNLSNGILIHSGGWKKLTEIAVDNQTFRQRLAERCGLRRIYNFYGMVEQMGSVFLEGEGGLLYPPNFADAIVRDPVSLEPVHDGSTGLIQTLSLLPRSYPGHSLLTEDLGQMHMGPRGRGLVIIGRAPRSELRGCSDTHAYGRSSG